MKPTPRFGLFLGQAGQSWAEILDRWIWAEELGFDQAFLVDHLQPTDGTDDASVLESWSLLAAIASRTSRIRIGTLVTSATFRHPSLLAKQATTIDHISGGRLILGIGTGWHEREHRAFGIPFPSAPERVARLGEAVEVIDRLMRGGRASFTGGFYDLDDAPFAPRPVQQPRVPFLIAAHRPRTLRLAARFADVWDTFPALEGAATEGIAEGIPDQVARFEELCREAGRDPRSIRRSTWTGGDAMRTPHSYVDFVERYAALGFTDFTTGLPGPSDAQSVERIARETIPELRERLSRQAGG